MWGDVRSGATHFERRQLPPPGHPVQQFFHGLSLPFHLIRALWAEPGARRRYLQVAILQSLVILALGLTCMSSADEAVDAAQEVAGQPEDTESARKRLERERFKLEVQLAAEELAHAIRARIGAAAEPAHGTDEIRRELEEIGRKLASIEAERSPTPLPEAVPAPAPPAAVEEEAPPGKGSPVMLLQLWVALFTVMQIAQWVVIALSHDFHDVVSRDASLLTGVAPEDEAITPRIRLDIPWMRKKLSRRIRAFMVWLAGMPVLIVLPTPFLCVCLCSEVLLAVLIPAWSAYWLVVFTASKSARAWDDTQAGDPWFLRGWTWLTTRVPGFRWGFLQGYGRFWARRTASLFAPASEAEKLPWAFAGLALVKALAIFPIAKSFLRPLISVASAHLIAAQRAASGAPVSGPPAPPAATSAPTA